MNDSHFGSYRVKDGSSFAEECRFNLPNEQYYHILDLITDLNFENEDSKTILM